MGPFGIGGMILFQRSKTQPFSTFVNSRRLASLQPRCEKDFLSRLFSRRKEPLLPLSMTKITEWTNDRYFPPAFGLFFRRGEPPGHPEPIGIDNTRMHLKTPPHSTFPKPISIANDPHLPRCKGVRQNPQL